MNKRFEKERLEMSDEELIKHADRAVSKLCETGGRSFTMTVPPRITDTDMILQEMIKRFKATSESYRGWADEYIKMSNLIFSKTAGDKSVTDPLANKGKQENIDDEKEIDRPGIRGKLLKVEFDKSMFPVCNDIKDGIMLDTDRKEDRDVIMSFNPDCLKKEEDRGSRFNEGKLRWSLVDLKCFEGLVKVLMMGAKKYSDYNWQKGLPINEVYESLMRHLVSFMDGEDDDAESGLSHLDHALCNIYFMKWFMDNKPEMDDRRKKKTVIPQQDFLEPKYPNENEN